jgi:hypothetical protein
MWVSGASVTFQRHFGESTGLPLAEMLWRWDHPAGADTEDHPVTQPDDMPNPDIASDLVAEACHKALARLDVMLALHQSEDHLIGEAASIITAWAQTLEADDMREHLGEMMDQLGDAMAVAEDEDEGSEIEDEDISSRTLNEKKLIGLQAMYEAFARAVDAMP